MRLPPHRHPAPSGPALPAHRPWEDAVGRTLARAEAAAVSWSARPVRACAVLAGAAAAIAAIGIPLGALLADDPAIAFRELMPGTWLSFAAMLACAAASWAVHTRTADAGDRWHATFWGLSAGAFAALAVVEIAQPTVFLSHWLQDAAGVHTAFGLADLDAVLVVLLLATVFVALLVRSVVLLGHPRSVVLFGIGVALAFTSQGLDSMLPATAWEFVAEESLKLAAEPFFLAGFLVALRKTSDAADNNT